MAQSPPSLESALELSIQLTNSLNPDTLFSNLRYVLNRILGDYEISIYEVEYRARNRRCRTVAQANIKESVLHDISQAAVSLQLSSSPFAVESLANNVPVRTVIREGSEHLFYPLKADFTSPLLIVIVAQSMDDDCFALVEKFLKVYINHLNVLSLSERDALTGLKNRQSFNHTLNSLLTAFKDNMSEVNNLCFAILDVDHFKHINDSYGHLFGDEVLLMISNIMQSEFRYEDHLFRYGGEEFAVILTNVNLDQAKLVLKRFTRSLSAHNFPQIDGITVSIGLVMAQQQHTTMQIIQQSDQALYWAKQNGRNRMATYEELVAQGKIIPAEIVEHQVELYDDDNIGAAG